MKKFVITLFAITCLCNISFAADTFLGWNCKNNVALKSAIEKDNKDVPIWQKIAYSLMIAENENPANINTLEKCTTIAKNACSTAGVKILSEEKIFSCVIQYFLCRNDKTILKEIISSPLAKKSTYYKTHYVVIKNWVGLSPAEHKEVMFEYLKQNVKSANIDDRFDTVFEQFLESSIEDESDIVVKKLQILYRLAIPKLATNEKMKLIVVKISLALKGYGVEAK